MQKVAFTTLGCKINQFETDTLMGLFKRAGYAVVEFDAFADVYVINTCSVTHLGERKSRQLIRRAVRRNPAAVIAVTGCYAQTAPDAVASIPGVNLIIGTQQRERIVALVQQAKPLGDPLKMVDDIMAAREFEDIPLYDNPGRTRAFLKIQEGCESFCSYCIIPYARGPLRSRTPDSVLSEVRKLVAAGFSEVVLTGIHLGAYGQDLPAKTDLAAMVEKILTVEGLQRLRLGSVEPNEITHELVELMLANPVLCRHLHLPLQSGHDDILRAMNRRYTAAEYRKLVQYLRFKLPDISVSTDLIVGFPGETDAHFAHICDYIADLALSRIHVFPYSARRGTPAAGMPGQVAAEVKEARSRCVIALAAEKERAFAAGFVGRVMPVLFEQADEERAEGLTGNYIRVSARAGGGVLGRILPVRLLEVADGGLNGEIAD
ncbi:MAG TPA: tRNA (N(6)-L-threonylcarbamoyladenosine(37)-C(2))-methylthiotransferase MtaB [Negativicutes bacterium]|nr:tRNA (N(6)-L-threonylcarbamoyladenosine(37)-C(2))-methylthiotransferase MtaB [Negativicutes bacterium]